MSGTGQTTQPAANDDAVDAAMADSFPASDPPSNTPTAGAGEAKGTPHSDREATESAGARTQTETSKP